MNLKKKGVESDLKKSRAEQTDSITASWSTDQRKYSHGCHKHVFPL